MFVNIIKSYRDVVAVCDSELLGKKFESDVPAGVRGEGIVRQLDVKESFYRNPEYSEPQKEEEVIKLMKSFSNRDATFNVVGPKAVQAAMKSGIINKENVGEVQGVPFALVLL